MSPTDAPYRSMPTEAKFVCVVCFQCASSIEGVCANCKNQMQPLARMDVKDIVCEEAQRRVGVIQKRQFRHASIIVVPLFLYLLLLTTIGRTLSFAIPGLVFLAIVIVHPYVFKTDARIARKYRNKPSSLSDAFDVLSTRVQ
jgi:hypothetical protein